MELRHLRTFAGVAKTLSFTRAAAELDYVQSSVTAQIKALETELGVRLFDRLGRRVALTDAGRSLLGYADRLLALAEEARLVTTGGEQVSGTVRVSAPDVLTAYRLPPVLQELRRSFPAVRLVFRPTSLSGTLDADLQRDLLDATIDLAFVLQEPLGSHGDFVAEALMQEPLLVVAHPEHRLATAPVVTAADLAGESILLNAKGCGYRALLESAMARSGTQLNGVVEFATGEAIKRCAEAGMGIAVMAAVSVADEVKSGRLAVLPWQERDFTVATQIVWHKDKWHSPAMRAFLDVAQRALRSPGADQVGGSDVETPASTPAPGGPPLLEGSRAAANLDGGRNGRKAAAFNP